MKIDARDIGIVLGILGGVYLWQRWRKNNDLTRHMDIEASTQENGRIVSTLDNAALDAYPLTTVGNEPFAGIMLDPFNPDNPATTPNFLDWLTPIPSDKRPEDLPFFMN